jgi:hypothetical protein
MFPLRSWLAMTFTISILDGQAASGRGFAAQHNDPGAGYQPCRAGFRAV